MKPARAKDWTVAAELDQTTVQHMVRNLKEGEEYEFRVYAKNAVGKGKAIMTDLPVKVCRPLGERIERESEREREGGGKREGI